MAVGGDVRIATSTFGANVEGAAEELSERSMGCAVAEKVDAAAVPAQAWRGLQKEVTDAVAIEIGGHAFDWLAVVVFEVVANRAANVSRDVDWHHALWPYRPRHLRRLHLGEQAQACCERADRNRDRLHRDVPDNATPETKCVSTAAKAKPTTSNTRRQRALELRKPENWMKTSGT